MKNAKQIQIAVVAAVVLVMGFLLLKPVKGLVDEEDQTASSATEEAADQYNFSTISEAAKRGLNPSIANEITELEGELEETDDDAKKLTVYQQLADKWNDVDKAVPQGFAYEEMGNIDSKFEYWLKAGDSYRKG